MVDLCHKLVSLRTKSLRRGLATCATVGVDSTIVSSAPSASAGLAGTSVAELSTSPAGWLLDNDGPATQIPDSTACKFIAT